jgi:cellulose synthase/poly-beta-1,6-N-acetylglucosamine synthase-like glycosyltransferase
MPALLADPAFWISFAQWVFLSYFVGLNLVYVTLNIVALRVIGRESAARMLAQLPNYSVGMEPGISVLVPAYNEEAGIAASVRSMLQLDYPDFEVIVINDGAKDGTLAVLQREFNLQLFPEAYRVALPVQHVRGIYRAPDHPRLRVIDKDNGGKADALNAGINSARHALVCAVDADSILQPDSLRRLVRPFMEDRRVVAAGGTVRIANGCRIERGFLAEVAVPSNWLARVQVVEYLRAFLFGRVGWSPINALLIISGAFGLFRRSAVIDAGGYRTNTIGEDMELVVRLHRVLRAQGSDYRIVFVPDPICWTEAPETLAVLKSQRVRWQRGLMESLWANRALMFSRRGGAVGWLAFPVMTVFEALGPIIELAGYVFMFMAFALGWVSADAFAAFMLLAVALGLMLSASALLLEELSFHIYPRTKHLLMLVAATVIENLGYRQLSSWWRIVGIYKWLRGKPGVWGEMARKGVGT